MEGYLEGFEVDGKRMEMASDATLRDYFAAKAMQSLITTKGRVYVSLCEIAYEVADAMLKARSAHN